MAFCGKFCCNSKLGNIACPGSENSSDSLSVTFICTKLSVFMSWRYENIPSKSELSRV